MSSPPPSAGNPVDLDPWQNIVGVSWRVGSLLGQQRWDLGEFGATGDYTLQALIPTVGGEVPGPGPGGAWTVNLHRVRVFLLRAFATPAPANFLQAHQMFPNDPDFLIAYDFGDPDTPNWEGFHEFLFPSTDLKRCWASFRLGPGHTDFTLVDHAELPAATSDIDYFTAAGLTADDLTAAGANTNEIIGILKVA